MLYINPGTNYWGIPFRIGALPEVTVLTLRRADAQGSAIVARSSSQRCAVLRRGAAASAWSPAA